LGRAEKGEALRMLVQSSREGAGSGRIKKRGILWAPQGEANVAPGGGPYEFPKESEAITIRSLDDRVRPHTKRPATIKQGKITSGDWELPAFITGTRKASTRYNTSKERNDERETCRRQGKNAENIRQKVNEQKGDVIGKAYFPQKGGGPRQGGI